MAACGTKLQHMFEKPLPDNPTLIESISSWNHHAHHQSTDDIFGKLHFKEVSHSPPPSMPSTDDEPETKSSGEDTRKLSVPFSSKCYIGNHKISDSFSSMSSESLQLCTEGLGFESSDTSDDLETQDYYWQQGLNRAVVKHSGLDSPPCGEIRRPRVRRGPFPPPISCIGKSGKPRVYFKSYKHDGRFVLKEIMIPTQECLHASREDGRLKLHFVHKDDDCDPKVYEEEDQEKED